MLDENIDPETPQPPKKVYCKDESFGGFYMSKKPPAISVDQFFRLWEKWKMKYLPKYYWIVSYLYFIV